MKKQLKWVPNTLTLGNLTLGFVSILISSEAGKNGLDPAFNFSLAGIFIVMAALFDGFDGMAARALDVVSELGADLDSLADLVTFGVAPGALMYYIAFHDLQVKLDFLPVNFPYGMLVASLYPICAAYRLARFNVAHDPKFFVGLPSPVAGVVVGFFPIAFSVHLFPHWIVAIAFCSIALLMVSTIRYSKPQVGMKEKLTTPRLFVILAGLTVLIFLFGLHNWPYVMYAIVLLYVFSGLVAFLIQTIQDLRV